MDEEVQPGSGYYLQPVDNADFRDSKRYVKSPLQSPTSDTEEPPRFGDLEGDGKRCVIYEIYGLISVRQLFIFIIRVFRVSRGIIESSFRNVANRQLPFTVGCPPFEVCVSFSFSFSFLV